MSHPVRLDLVSSYAERLKVIWSDLLCLSFAYDHSRPCSIDHRHATRRRDVEHTVKTYELLRPEKAKAESILDW